MRRGSGLEINFEYVKDKEPFVDEQLRREFLERLNAVSGIQISPDRIDKRPSIRYESLQDDQLREGFCDVMDWAISKIREAR